MSQDFVERKICILNFWENKNRKASNIDGSWLTTTHSTTVQTFNWTNGT